MLSCGSKKKTTEITKEERHEKKDLSVFHQRNRLSVITFTKDATEMIIEPLPYNPLIIGKDTIKGAKKVTYRKTRVDSTVQDTVHETVQVKDKGEVKETKKEKNIDLDREGSSDGWVKIIWGFVFLLVIIAIGKWKKWF